MREGDTLWTSFANANRAGREADALLHEIENALSTMSSVQVTDWVDNNFIESDSEYGWSYGYQWVAWGLRRRGKHGRFAQCGTVTFALSFWREEDEIGHTWEHAKRSKLYVGFDPSKLSHESHWTHEGLFIGGDGAVAEDCFRQSPYLVIWNDGQPPRSDLRDCAWFFCVALDALNSREDIVTQVLQPLDRILSGASQEEAFEGARAALEV